MAKSEARRQKHLAKRKAKRAERQRSLRQLQTRGVKERLIATHSAPILESIISLDIDDQGIGIVLLSRDLGSEVAFASFLVDRYCLGVKDVHADVVPVGAYRALVSSYEKRMEFDNAAPATVRRLVEDAVAYARDLGFSPHADYAKGREIFGDINPDLADETFEMGKDGKPFYIAGPHESTQRSKHIVHTLAQKCGPGNCHYFCSIEPDELIGPHFALEFDDGDVWEEVDIDEESSQ